LSDLSPTSFQNEKTEEQGEKNAVLVPLVPANTALRHAKLKQPVAEASINGDP